MKVVMICYLAKYDIIYANPRPILPAFINIAYQAIFSHIPRWELPFLAVTIKI